MTDIVHEQMQAAINKMYLGLQAQGWKRSVNDNNSCRYRGYDGRKCAIGHLIPDEAYDSKYETCLPSVDGAIHGLLRVSCGLPDIGFPEFSQLREFQRIHDDPSSPIPMEERFTSYAHHLGYTVPSDKKDGE